MCVKEHQRLFKFTITTYSPIIYSFHSHSRVYNNEYNLYLKMNVKMLLVDSLGNTLYFCPLKLHLSIFVVFMLFFMLKN